MLQQVSPVLVKAVPSLGIKKAAKEEPLPQPIAEPGLQKDVFQKQNKLNSICALTDGYATPMMA